MSDNDALRIEDDGPVRHLILNRPEKLNAIDITQHERLMAAFPDRRPGGLETWKDCLD